MAKLLTQWLCRVGSAKWVLVDQVWVSTLNFVTGIFLARSLGVEGYGQFILSYSVVLYANTLQQALIIAPMLSIAPQLDAIERTKYLRGMFSLQITISVILSAAILLIGSVAGYFSHSWTATFEIFPLSLSVLFFQLQDWLRRYYFISGKSIAAFCNDVISYGGQVLALAILFNMRVLTIRGAFWAIALTSAIAFLIGVVVEKLYPLRQQSLPAFQKSWKSSSNLLVAGQVNWLGSQGILVLSGFILGTQALGGLRAIQNITGPFNILLQGMENFVPIKAAQKYTQGQFKGLTHFLIKISVFGGIALAIPSIGIAIFSKNLMVLAYGQEYAVYSNLIIWQLLICLMTFLCFQGFYFFRTIDQTQQILFGSIIASLISITSTLLLGQSLHSIGIMLSILLGQFGYVFYFGMVISKHSKRLTRDRIE